MTDSRVIVALAVALGAERVGGPLSTAERELVVDSETLGPVKSATVSTLRTKIRQGADPLGEMFYSLRSAEVRRAAGAIYTPTEIVEPMVTWTLEQGPDRVVDAGCGSGRYTAAVLRHRKSWPVVAVDLDPLATLLTRAVVASLGGTNVTVLHADFTRLRLPEIWGTTAFLGNPPYVRHHQLTSATKAWAQMAGAVLGHKVSGLAGLHAYFYLAAAVLGKPGDIGCFVTSAEWLDVNYGSIIRGLLVGPLGGRQIHVVEPQAMPFDGTATTAAIVQFRIGGPVSAVGFRSVPSLAEISPLVASSNPVARERLLENSRWSVFVRTRVSVPAGHIELGEIARVHRGAVTGANATWVAQGATDLPSAVLFPSVTKARELFAAEGVLKTNDQLRNVIDIPTDLDAFDAEDRRLIDRFLRAAKGNSVHKGYVARARKAWWAVGLKMPAPILATYMARRPPAFVRNDVQARHINIAHGIYPREVMSKNELRVLAECLSSSVLLAQGRTYAGGLTKFEPREMERITIPDLATLMQHDASRSASTLGSGDIH